MPSDRRTSDALAATAAPRERYRAAVAVAAEQVGAYLDARRARRGDAAQAALAELGAFARGRIDGARFASLVGGPRELAPDALAVVQRAEAALQSLLARGDAPFTVDLPAGGDLRAAVHGALAGAGTAFGAALVFQAVKSGVYRAEQHDAHLVAFPFARWNHAERLLAPPLVVTLDGADVHADALGEALDGREKIVLVVRGASTPAPLVRLVTPGTFVAQDTDGELLARAVAFAGPAVVALVPETAARFVHDPAAGGTLAERLTVSWAPAEAPRTALGGRSAAQQRDELAQLRTLAELAKPTPAATPPSPAAVPAVPAVTAAIPAVAAATPSVISADAGIRAPAVGAPSVDALTDWLLAQAGLPGGAVRP